MQGAWSGCFQGYRGEAMHYLGYELPRILIPPTPVNRAAKAHYKPCPASRIVTLFAQETARSEGQIATHIRTKMPSCPPFLRTTEEMSLAARMLVST